MLIPLSFDAFARVFTAACFNLQEQSVLFSFGVPFSLFATNTFCCVSPHPLALIVQQQNNSSNNKMASSSPPKTAAKTDPDTKTAAKSCKSESPASSSKTEGGEGPQARSAGAALAQQPPQPSVNVPRKNRLKYCSQLRSRSEIIFRSDDARRSRAEAGTNTRTDAHTDSCTGTRTAAHTNITIAVTNACSRTDACADTDKHAHTDGHTSAAVVSTLEPARTV